MGAAWEGWFTVAVVVLAFGCLLWDLIQPDHVMIGALALLMASGVVTVEEGLAGFANEGLLTVATLFVVAAGISATGGLDWYMGKLLGRPRTIAGAQLRLMLPIALVSGFLNNTPVVAVDNPHRPALGREHPHTERAGHDPALLRLHPRRHVYPHRHVHKPGRPRHAPQLARLERRRRGGQDEHGPLRPRALRRTVRVHGHDGILLASRALLPGEKAAARRAKHGDGDGGGRKGAEDLIVGARLQPWSAACGKTVAGSGLRGLPGLYLVSVKRDDALMRAVGPEFVLAQGDVLYFTGMVESLGRVCAEHGLEAVSDGIRTAARRSRRDDEIGVGLRFGRHGCRRIGRGVRFLGRGRAARGRRTSPTRTRAQSTSPRRCRRCPS